jgi:putative transposase
MNRKYSQGFKQGAVDQACQPNVTLGQVAKELGLNPSMLGRCRDAFLIRMMCRLLLVSSSGYYAWVSRSLSAQAAANYVLLNDIFDLHEDSDGVWGAPTITDVLNMKGIKCSVNRVARLMKSNGLQGT